MRSSSLESAVDELDAALAAWTCQRVDGHDLWIGPDATGLSQVAVRWPIGYQDEQPGESGFAHLAEHTLFRGADGRTHREERLLAAGGITNGRTNRQGTLFWSAAAPAARADAWANEAHRYAEPVSASWVEHQAAVVRAELVEKAAGSCDGYVRIRRAVEAAGPSAATADGFVQDALASGLEGFADFLERGYAASPTVSVSGWPAEEALALLERHAFRGDVRVDEPIAHLQEPGLGDQRGGQRDAVGDAELVVVDPDLRILERVLLSATLRRVMAGIPATQLRLHLWGDAASETTRTPFLLMLESGEGSLEAGRQRLRTLDRAALSLAADEALPDAAAQLRRLAAELAGPWAAATWSGLIEREDDRSFSAPRSAIGTPEEALAAVTDVLISAVETAEAA